MNMTIATSKVKEAIAAWSGDRAAIEAYFTNTNKVGFDAGTVISFKTELLPKEFLIHLHDNAKLSDSQRVTLNTAINGVAADTSTMCSKPSDVHAMISSLRATDGYNAEISIGKRWYPIKLTAKYHTASQGYPAHVEISANTTTVDVTNNTSWYMSSIDFEDEDGGKKVMSGKDVLAHLGLRFMQTDMTEYARKLQKAQHAAGNAGVVMGAIATGMVRAKFGWTEDWMIIELGTKDAPHKVVIEPELDSQNGRRRNVNSDMQATALPFVRAFSLDRKRYVYLDVEDILHYEFDKTVIDRLVLPPKEKGIITKIFNSDIKRLFGDVMKDKHGGMIILANGPTGTGKTLTAEVFAEMTERPLYIMEMAELGIDVKTIEQNLEGIFRRVTKWNAVLLMDEADVFLAARGDSLERSVIVGIFLRLMDYYRGLLFLTSNRGDVIDPAFKSRITLRLDYPELAFEARETIWGIMLKQAGIKVIGSLLPTVKLLLNGRQIRNMVRLVKVLHGDRVHANEIWDICQFTAK